MKKFIPVLLLLLSIININAAYSASVWRVADEEDAIDDWARFNSPNRVIADFNLDGLQDIAQIFIKNNSNKGFLLAAEINNRQIALKRVDDVPAQAVSIELIKPSDKVWQSACAKGYWDCEENEVRQFKVTKPSLMFCFIESSCTVYLWSNRNQDFTEIPISD